MLKASLALTFILIAAPAEAGCTCQCEASRLRTNCTDPTDISVCRGACTHTGMCLGFCQPSRPGGIAEQNRINHEVSEAAAPASHDRAQPAPWSHQAPREDEEYFCGKRELTWTQTIERVHPRHLELMATDQISARLPAWGLEYLLNAPQRPMDAASGAARLCFS
jgi:hypothetical protein